MKTLEMDGQIKAFDPEKPFGSITEELRTTLPNSRVLAEIIVDNRPIDLSEEEELNQKAFKNLGQVVIRSRRVDELFRESLQVSPRICEALQMDCDDMEQFIEKQEYTQAQERLAEMSSLLEWLIQLVVGAQSLGEKRIEELSFEGGRVMDSMNRMQFQLAQLHFHLGAGNWTEFRKMMTGDFKRELKTWESIFTSLAQTWTPNVTARES